MSIEEVERQVVRAAYRYALATLGYQMGSDGKLVLWTGRDRDDLADLETENLHRECLRLLPECIAGRMREAE